MFSQSSSLLICDFVLKVREKKGSWVIGKLSQLIKHTRLLKQITGHILSPKEQQQHTHPKQSLNTQLHKHYSPNCKRKTCLPWRNHSPFNIYWQIFLQDRVYPWNRGAVLFRSNLWYKLLRKFCVESIWKAKSRKCEEKETNLHENFSLFWTEKKRITS